MTRESGDGEHELLKVDEFAKLMRVDPRTVSRWCRAGDLPRIKTPGGHYRIRREVARLIMNGELPRIDPDHLEDDDAGVIAQVAS